MNEGHEDMRLLLPAKGAATRPVAWRMRAENSDGPAGSVVVVAPPGSVSAELIAGGRTIPVPLDAAGSGTAQLAPGMEAVVRARHASGAVIGATPVPQLEDSTDGVPGDTAATRVVP